MGGSFKSLSRRNIYELLQIGGTPDDRLPNNDGGGYANDRVRNGEAAVVAGLVTHIM